MQELASIKTQGGQTMIEVLVALSVAVVVIAAIAISVITALYNSQFSKNQNLATQYAQQGMELVKQLRNSDSSVFLGFESGKYCLDKNSSLSSSSVRISASCESSTRCPQNVDSFIREVCIERDSDYCGGERKVTVELLWSDSKCKTRENLFCHEVKLDSCFSDANIMQSP